MIFVVAVICAMQAHGAIGVRAAPAVQPSLPPPTVIQLSVVQAKRIALLLHALYPAAIIRPEQSGNAVVVVAPPDQVAGMKVIAAGLDVRDPTSASVEAIALHSIGAHAAAQRLRGVFPKARFVAGPNQALIVTAAPIDMPQIRAVVQTIDTPPATPTPRPVFTTAVIKVAQASPRQVARAIAHAVPALGVAVSGYDILVTGSVEAEERAKTIASSLDHPARDVPATRLFHLRNVDADSVADLLRKTFSRATFAVDKSLNTISVTAIAPTDDDVADAISQLDANPGVGGPPGAAVGVGGIAQTEVIRLKAAVPAPNGQGSTSATDIAQSITQVLGPQAADLHIVVPPNSTRMIVSGSPYSVQLAKDLIAKLDVAEPLVELDTEVYEVDDGLQKQLGVRFPTAALSTTYSEVAPAATADGVSPRLGRLQALTRTPLTLQAQLDFLISTNRARILEDPRITTFSGRTASLRAGETVNILTTAGGGTGTIATTQVQSFQTGVTLDITPVVNIDDYITVTLHPSVNTIAGISAAGVPNIQTRDTTTTVGLRDGQTIVVGGLIEDTDSRTVQKIPLLGELPIIGRLFQDVGTSHTRNELVVTVTPHILHDDVSSASLDSDLPIVPRHAVALPKIDPHATLPPRRVQTQTTPAGLIATSVSLANNTPPPLPQPEKSAPPASESLALSQTNIFTYGSPPANNFADSSQPPQIFYLRAEPSVVKLGQPIRIEAVTTSNVTTLSLGDPTVSFQQALGMLGSGKWQGAYIVNSSFSGAGRITLTVVAHTTSGATTSIQIPIAVQP